MCQHTPRSIGASTVGEQAQSAPKAKTAREVDIARRGVIEDYPVGGAAQPGPWGASVRKV
jgi:hypothetical protein